jgi:hypothetical protein
MKERLLVHGLHRAGDVAVSIQQGIFGATARTEEPFESGRKQIAEFR